MTNMTFVHLRGQPLWPRTQSNGIRKKLNIHAHDEGPLSMFGEKL